MANTKSCSSVLASGACGGIIWSQTALSEPTPPIQPPVIHAVPSLAELQSVFVAFLCGHPMALALATSCSHHQQPVCACSYSLWSYGPSTPNIL